MLSHMMKTKEVIRIEMRAGLAALEGGWRGRWCMCIPRETHSSRWEEAPVDLEGGWVVLCVHGVGGGGVVEKQGTRRPKCLSNNPSLSLMAFLLFPKKSIFIMIVSTCNNLCFPFLGWNVPECPNHWTPKNFTGVARILSLDGVYFPTSGVHVSFQGLQCASHFLLRQSH